MRVVKEVEKVRSFVQAEYCGDGACDVSACGGSGDGVVSCAWRDGGRDPAQV